MTTHSGTSLLGEPLVLPDSLWADTAVPAPPTRTLSGTETADVLIIGAGFTGLSAATHLSEAGQSCLVLDAAEPGWGASGRNNGQIIAGLKQDPDVIERLYPGEMGRRFVEFGDQAPSEVFGLIRQHGIDCAASQNGWIQPAFSKHGLRAVQHRCEAWQQRGVDARLLEGD
ncbi:NAD(P)/FAD-dependent oxidoreductase, partial [Oceanisphaera psychrotolerans]|uniref:NAD(P)/FAD-dependent oxidoreductase n=1 Tax=Oceanisphaera psychrotolerans TaxID=1414654 RepID=UPI0011145086